MTETGAGARASWRNREPRHVGTHCFGRAEPFVEARLVDDEGARRRAGAPGELLVRAAGADPRRDFFSGYLKDEAATEEAWAGGWFHTGDVVRRDADGNLYFVDRKKNVIRRSGENISAVEVESVLNQHPAVKASAVAAAPDDGARRRGAGLHRHARAGAAPPSARSSRRSIVEHALGAARVLQGARLCRLRRRAAADAVAEDPARRAAQDGAGAAGAGALHRHAGDEEAAGMTSASFRTARDANPRRAGARRGAGPERRAHSAPEGALRHDAPPVV